MKLGIFFVMMLAGSSASLGLGIGMILTLNYFGIFGIIFGTIGMLSYFILCLVANELFNTDVSMEKIE